MNYEQVTDNDILIAISNEKKTLEDNTLFKIDNRETSRQTEWLLRY